MPRRRVAGGGGPSAGARPKRARLTPAEEGSTMKNQMYKVDLCWELDSFDVFFPNPAEEMYSVMSLPEFLEETTADEEFNLSCLTDGQGTFEGWQKEIKCKLQTKLDETPGPAPTVVATAVANIFLETVVSFNLVDTFFSDGGKYCSRNIKLVVSIVDKHGKVLHTAVDTNADGEGRTPEDAPEEVEFRRRLPRLQDIWNSREIYIPDNILRLKYEFVFLRHSNQPRQAWGCFPKTMSTLSEDLAKLFHDGVGTDFVVKCGGTEFPVHQTILRARSPVFANMLSTNMMEAAAGVVQIEDVDPGAMKAVLEYIYSSIINPEQYELNQLLAITMAAEKYELGELKDICLQYLANNMQNMEPTTLGQLAALSHMVSSKIQVQVVRYCVDNFSSLSQNEGFISQVRKIPTNLFQQLEFLTKFKDY